MWWAHIYYIYWLSYFHVQNQLIGAYEGQSIQISCRYVAEFIRSNYFLFKWKKNFFLYFQHRSLPQIDQLLDILEQQ